jgi:hypothetical protein
LRRGEALDGRKQDERGGPQPGLQKIEFSCHMSRSDASDEHAADLLSSDDSEGSEGAPDAQPAPAQSALLAAPDPQHADEIAALRQRLAYSARDYDAYARLVELLSGGGDVAAAREVREAMSAQFPLSERLWLDWIADEKAALAAAGGDAAATVQHRDYILSLYGRGTGDYLSVTLWLHRALFLLEGDAPEPSVRAALEDAVAAAGLHPTEGGRLWIALTHFERQTLEALGAGGEAAAARATQLGRVRAVYRRRLAVPHLELAAAIAECAEFEQATGAEIESPGGDAAGESAATLARAAHATRAMEALLAFETAVFDANAAPEGRAAAASHALSVDQWAAWQAYVAHEASANAQGAVRAALAYERCVAAAPLHEPAWRAYVAFARASKRLGATAATVCERAARNVATCAELWSTAILEFGRFGFAPSRAAAAFGAGCGAGLRGGHRGYDRLLAAYLGHLCRALPPAPAPPTAEQVDGLRRLFALGDYYLNSGGHDGGGAPESAVADADYDDGFGRLCARVEALRLGDVAAARARWEKLLKRQGTRAEAWLEAVALVLEAGAPPTPASPAAERAAAAACAEPAAAAAAAALVAARAYFKRGLAFASAPSTLAAAWLRFERVHGSADELALAEARVAKRLDELTARAVLAAAAEPKSAAPRKRERSAAPKKPAKADGADADGAAPSAAGAAARAQKRARVEPAHDATAATAAAGAAAAARAPPPPPPPPARTRAHAKTLFIASLEKSVDAAVLRAWLENEGGAYRLERAGAVGCAVLDVRFLLDRATGRPRGCAYVDVGAADGAADEPAGCEEAAAYAVGLDGVFLRGQKVAVAISKPPARRDAAEDPRTLFLSNLSAAVGAAELRDLCGAHGALSADGVRLIPDKSGHPKGFAYVEFLDAASAAAARAALDGALVAGRPLAVTQARQQPPLAAGGDEGGRGGGGSSGSVAGRGGYAHAPHALPFHSERPTIAQRGLVAPRATPTLTQTASRDLPSDPCLLLSPGLERRGMAGLRAFAPRALGRKAPSLSLRPPPERGGLQAADATAAADTACGATVVAPAAAAVGAKSNDAFRSLVLGKPNK